jgi:hypothetical protein
MRHWVIALDRGDETAFYAVKLLWLQGLKPSANVGGTGSVPDGRKEGT